MTPDRDRRPGSSSWPALRSRRRHREALVGAALEVFREVFPDVPPDVPIRCRRLPSDGWHDMMMVTAPWRPDRRLVLKALPPPDRDTPRQMERRGSMLATEHRLLSEVAPRIAARNPATRCPRALAYRAAPGLLAVEAVRGPSLERVLFGLAPTRERRDVGRLLELCGEWLARFHELTRTGEEGNPFDWAVEAFASPAVGDVFARCGAPETQPALCDLARALRAAHPAFRAPRCRIHGVFAPYHVLVSGGCIYVLDLESSRAGYAHEDLGLFAAYYDFRLPWRAALGSARLPIGEQLGALRRGYARHAPPFGEPDELLLRLARLRALIRIPVTWAHVARPHRLKAALRWRWWHRRFRLAFEAEMPALRRAAGR